MGLTKNALKGISDIELLSYIINVTPELREDIDLPKQGDSVKEYGKLIMDCQRHKNAYLNTCNLIGLTVARRNYWESDWDFTYKGEIPHGETVREMIVDLAPVFDYNKNVDDVTRFLKTVVPDVYTYMHEINVQKFYQQTTSDDQMAMAFERGDLFGFIDLIISMNYESLKFDLFQLDKYIIARRIIDGTITPVTIDLTADNRDQAAKILKTSNDLKFRSRNYNPAGVSRANSAEEQILIVTNAYQADFDVKTLSTSFHLEKVENKQGIIKLIDSFGEFDTERLAAFIGTSFVPFTDEELNVLKAIPAMIISKDFFMNYSYSWGVYDTAMDGYTRAFQGRTTEFYNPTSLKNSHFLHYWGIASSSPYEQAVCFTGEDGEIVSVEVTPSTATLAVGATLRFTANVNVTGVINKAVRWEVDDETKAKIKADGTLEALEAGDVTITAISIADDTKQGTATLTIQ